MPGPDNTNVPGPDNTTLGHDYLSDRRTLTILPILFAVVGLAIFFWLR